MMLSELALVTVVACPNCISSVGGSGVSYLQGTILMLAAPLAIAAVIAVMFRRARAATQP